MDMTALGKHIKAAREKKHMTQEELAAAIDYSVDHMSVVERGVKPPRLEKLILIANVLEVSTDYLLQDYLNSSILLQASDVSEKIKSLPPDRQRKALRVLDTLISELKAE